MSKHTNRWTMVAQALRAGLNSLAYSETQYMCNTIYRLARHHEITQAQHEAYLKLWLKLAKKHDNGSLMGYLSDAGLLPDHLWWSDHRLTVGYAFWTAVATYIECTDKPTLAGVRKAGAKAVKALKL